MTTAAEVRSKATPHIFIPREHGATAMLLTPFIAAAILLRDFQWLELVALVAIMAAFSIKDPLIVLARQRFVWKSQHPETQPAARAAGFLLLVLLSCGILLVIAGKRWQLLPFVIGATAFAALAVVVNVRNKQRSEWFQVASAGALSATCLIACLAAIGRVPDWSWVLWVLSTLQAATGIFVVHARLDARIAARTESGAPNRQPAFIAVAAMFVAAVLFLYLGRFWIVAALILAALGFLVELQRQRDPESLRKPFTRVGLQALGQATVYTALVVMGLWER